MLDNKGRWTKEGPHISVKVNEGNYCTHLIYVRLQRHWLLFVVIGDCLLLQLPVVGTGILLHCYSLHTDDSARGHRIT